MLHAVFEYLKYYFRAETKYRIHSPSLFKFVNEVMEMDYAYYCYGKIEALRSQLLQNHQSISVTDLGAGSNFSKSNSRKIRKIASTAVSSYSKCKLLYRIATFYRPRSILELGTSLGISTSYLANIAPTTTIEGSSSIGQVAQSIFDQQKIDVDLQIGDIGQVLDVLASKGKKFDFIYADGNHRKQATLSYFNQLIPMLNPSGIILFDDIYWSKEMTEAWVTIKTDPRVNRTIDLYTFGIVTLGAETTSHKSLIQSYLKPFQWGFISGKA